VPALAGVGNVGMLPRRRKKMKIGDLVKYQGDDDRPGIIMGFDEDGDPIVHFFYEESAAAYLSDDIEVISESR
jgi:hypothetical protein